MMKYPSGYMKNLTVSCFPLAEASIMHDIWNPWQGCVKCSEGCQNCYMYFLDRQRNRDGSDIFKTKSGFNYPLQMKRSGGYKIQSGELIRVCMTSY